MSIDDALPDRGAVFWPVETGDSTSLAALASDLNRHEIEVGSGHEAP